MTECDLLIEGCHLLQPDMTIREHVSIAIVDSRIVAIGAAEEIRRQYQSTTTLDGNGKLALPGFVDAHTHTAQQLLRGRTVDEPPMVWARILVPYESHLEPEDVRLSALLCCVEMIKAGVTAFADAGGPYMHMAAEAVQESGIRAAIAPSTMDQGEFVPPVMKHTADEIASKTEELYEAYDGTGNGRVRIFFGLRQVMTSTPELVDQVAAAARQYNTGIHIHLAEHLPEVEHCLVNYRMRPAEWLYEHSLLGPNVIAGHGVLLTEREIALLAETDVKVVHCPRSNLSSHGFAKTPLLCTLGVSVGLGSDGAASGGIDHFNDMRILKYAMQARYGLPIREPAALSSKQVFEMATRGGARALQMENQIGTLEVDKKADIILVDLEMPHLTPSHNIFQTLITAAAGRDVQDVIVDGQLLLKDRELVHLDEEAIRAHASEHLRAVAQRAGL